MPWRRPGSRDRRACPRAACRSKSRLPPPGCDERRPACPWTLLLSSTRSSSSPCRLAWQAEAGTDLVVCLTRKAADQATTRPGRGDLSGQKNLRGRKKNSSDLEPEPTGFVVSMFQVDLQPPTDPGRVGRGATPVSRPPGSRGHFL